MFKFVVKRRYVLLAFPSILLLAMGWPSINDDAATIIYKSASMISCRGCTPEGEGEPEGEVEGEEEGEVEGEAEGEGEVVVGGEGEYVLPVVDIGTRVSVPAGEFKMGRAYEDEGFEEEVPAHDVNLSAYSIGKYPVTNKEYVAVLNWAQGKDYFFDASGGPFVEGLVYAYGQPIVDTFTASDWSEIDFVDGVFVMRQRVGYNNQKFSLEYHPVVRVSWYGAVAYCNWLSEMEGLEPCYDTASWERFEPVRNGYRLPTEAEWEYAAAWDAAQARHWRFGVSSDTLAQSQANHLEGIPANPLGLTTLPYTSPVGWYNGKNPVRISDLKTLTIDSPSPVGVYDMAGNVWEWCHDRYGEDYYATSPVENPTGPERGNARILRGGAWNFDYRICRAAVRMRNDPDYRLYVYGFRVCRSQ